MKLIILFLALGLGLTTTPAFAAQGVSASSSEPSDSAPRCSRKAGSLPQPLHAAGTRAKIPVQHIVVIMQENHSFDSYLGRLNKPQFYGSEVDGVTDLMSQPDRIGKPVYSYHEDKLCIPDTNHSWNGEHSSWNEGHVDGFVRTNGTRTMAYYDENEIPYYYALANQFAVADRYFSSVLTSTFPNRYFLYAATAFGHIRNDEPPAGGAQFSQPTIFDRFDEFGITWKYYTDDRGYLKLFQPMWRRDQNKMAKIAGYYSDLRGGQLPEVSFIDAEWDGQDEHPAADVQRGQEWVSELINSLMASTSWSSSALFLTYDENGGFFDHVTPPQACVPDSLEPKLPAASLPGNYGRYGFRVPFILVSPFAKHHYVSHVTYDHTSILKFIETKFNLPALTIRDANADGMNDLFDFKHPVLPVQNLPSGVANPTLLCK